jgi:hypothetical protein
MPECPIDTTELLDARVNRLRLDIVEWREDQRLALAAKTARWNVHRSD